MASKPPPLPIGRADDDPSAISDRDLFKKKVNASLGFVVSYVVLLVVVGIILFSFSSVRPPSESISTWVERFGALVGILSLLIDSKLRATNSYLDTAAMHLPPALFQSLKTSYRYIPYCEKAALFFAIVGAITWAYGSVIIFWVGSIVQKI